MISKRIPTPFYSFLNQCQNFYLTICSFPQKLHQAKVCQCLFSLSYLSLGWADFRSVQFACRALWWKGLPALRFDFSTKVVTKVDRVRTVGCAGHRFLEGFFKRTAVCVFGYFQIYVRMFGILFLWGDGPCFSSVVWLCLFRLPLLICFVVPFGPLIEGWLAWENMCWKIESGRGLIVS